MEPNNQISAIKLGKEDVELWLAKKLSSKDVNALVHIRGHERDMDFIGFRVEEMIIEQHQPEWVEGARRERKHILGQIKTKLIITLGQKPPEGEAGRLFSYIGEKSVPKILTEIEQRDAIEKQVKDRTLTLENRIEELELTLSVMEDYDDATT